jgi:hypothetical protein
MPRYEPRWVKVAGQQRDNLPVAARRLVKRRIDELLEDPTGNPAATYDGVEDEWSIPIGADAGLILYAVVDEPRRVVILLRLAYLGE